MSPLSRYLTTQIITTTCAITILCTTMFWIIQIEKIVKKYSLNIDAFITYTNITILTTPYILMSTIPLALLLSLLLVFNKLKKQQTILIMSTAGMSIWKITSPIIKFSICISLLLAIIDFWINPKSIQMIQDKKFQIIYDITNLHPNTQTFEYLFKDIMFYADSQSKDGFYKNITLHDSRKNNTHITYTAKTGNWITKKNNIQLLMTDGTIYTSQMEGSSQALTFEKYAFQISHIIPPQETKRTLTSLYIQDLLNPSKTQRLNNAYKQHIAEAHKRITNIPFPIIITMITIIMALNTVNDQSFSKSKIVTGIMFIALYTILKQYLSYKIDNNPNFISLSYALPVTYFIMIFIVILKMSLKYRKR